MIHPWVGLSNVWCNDIFENIGPWREEKGFHGHSGRYLL